MANNNQKPGDKERAIIDLADLTPEQAARAYDDGSDSYANERDYYIHIRRRIGNSKVHVKFKAFVTAFSDTYDPDYEEEPGKISENGKVFTFLSRKITLSFDIVASTYEEAKLNLTRLSQFGRLFYPDQAGKNTNKAPKFEIRFANLIRGMYSSSYLSGYIEQFTFEPDFESGIFERHRAIVPKVYKMNIEFTPYHENKTNKDGTATMNWLNGKWNYGYNYPYRFSEKNPQTKQIGDQANGSAAPNAVGSAVGAAVNQVVKQGQKIAKSALASQGNNKSDQTQKAESTSEATADQQLERFDKTGRSMRNRMRARNNKALGQ